MFKSANCDARHDLRIRHGWHAAFDKGYSKNVFDN